MSVFVFGYTVGTWPHAMTEAERRSKGKSFKVMFFFQHSFISESTNIQGNYSHFHVFFKNSGFPILHLSLFSF